MSKQKAVALELIGGAAGWIWLGASVAVLYYAYQSIVNDQPWSSAGLALLVAFLSKAIARVLEQKKNATMDNSDAKRAVEWVSDFGGVLEKYSGCVAVDDSVLPVPKAALKKAFRYLLTSPDYAGSKETLVAAYLSLSMFQTGVGDSPVKDFLDGLDTSNLHPESDEFTAILDQVTSNSDETLKWQNIVMVETGTLQAELVALG